MTKNSQPLRQEGRNDFTAPSEPAFQLAVEDAPAALEALLFAAGDPLTIDKIRQITGLDRQTLERLLGQMAEGYDRDRRRGVMLREAEGSWFFCTKPEQADVLQRLFQPRHRPPLSQAAYETLAIIAYNQPVTRSQVEAVRGVNSDSIITRLMERNLINEAGSLDAPGRPTLFVTTDQFLIDFGLRSVKDLPPMEMLMYGTLRDFERSLEIAAGHRRDDQMTIDQLVDAFLPEPPDKLDKNDTQASE
ncbi:MAG: SMC-Scp complex subunit ScpB [Saccharofermentanales bacterium]|jgi:segregation and condensation protein B|nr:SMC-Scp complex subunit ScpB [Clostridiaceae bacterium]